MTAATASRPFLPSDLDNSRSLARVCTVRAIAALKHEDPAAIMRQSWPRDRSGLELLTRATSEPAALTGTWGGQLAGNTVASFISGLAPASAAAQIIQRGVRVSLAGVGSVSIPYLDSAVTPGFIGPGDPIGVSQMVLDAGQVGPAKKIAAIIPLTGELADMSTPDALVVIETMLREAGARQLDVAILSDAAGSSLRPPGILNGVSALTPTAGGGSDAMLGDVQALGDAIGTAGGGGSIMFVASPGRALKMRIMGVGGLADVPVIGSPAIEDDTLVAIDPSGFASGFGAEPQIDIATEATLHMDTAAEPIADDASSGGGLASGGPVRSLFQTNSLALRLIMRAAWAVRAPGLVQTITGTTW